MNIAVFMFHVILLVITSLLNAVLCRVDLFLHIKQVKNKSPAVIK